MADNTILSRLDGLKLKYEETGQKLTDPEVIADVKQFVQLNKEYKELEPIIETSERYRTAVANLAEAKDTLAMDKDEEMREMAREMIAELEPQLVQMEEEIKLLLIPKDPQDSKTPSSKSAAARAATRRRSSPATCCACTPNTSSRKAGVTRSPRRRRAPWAASKRWC